MIRPAIIEDASSLAAISLEVWLNTYIRDGVNAFFADYALEAFTTARLADILSQENESIWVSQNKVGIAEQGRDRWFSADFAEFPGAGRQPFGP